MNACPSCQTDNDAANLFCVSCGTRLSGPAACRSCGAVLAAGARFCAECGITVAAEPEVPAGPGYVVDGEWHRSAGEFVRRVPISALQTGLRGKRVRVPMGSVGAVIKDGVCRRLLAPGLQTTQTWLDELSRVLGGDVHGVYLIDRRPIPVFVAADVATDRGLVTVQTRVLVSVGSSTDAVTAFVSDWVRDRESLTADALHIQLRAEIDQLTRDALQAARGDWARTEKDIRTALAARHGARHGLSFDVTVAPRSAVHRHDLRLGDAPAPAMAPCATCGAELGVGQRFCVACGTPRTRVDADGARLFTSDGVEVEVDVSLGVQGPTPTDAPVDALFAAAARALRGAQFDAVATADGLAALESALADAAAQALEVLGARVLDVSVVDLRSRTGEWLTHARADMERIRSDLVVGREWLAVAGDESDLRELTLGLVRTQQRIDRDHAFALREAAVADAERAADLDHRERTLERSRRSEDHTDAMGDLDRRYEAAKAEAEHRAELQRKQAALGSEGRRLSVDDEVYGTRQRDQAQLDRLAALASLEAQVAEREHAEKLDVLDRMKGRSEAEILAMQAADLADSAHGAAFAEALARAAEAKAANTERDRQEVRYDAQVERMSRLAEAAMGRAADAHDRTSDAYRDAADSARSVAETTMASNARVVAARAAGASCDSCGTALKPGAPFCGGCGARQ